MSSADVIPPMHYGVQWLIIGLVLLILVVGWYGLVWFLTRKRRAHTLDTLKVRPVAAPDKASIITRYIAMIDAVEHDYTTGQLSARAAHQKLSYLARFFVYEVTGRRAYSFTLADIRKARLPELEAMIEGVYPPEFAEIVDADVRTSCQKAREMVSSWQ